MADNQNTTGAENTLNLRIANLYQDGDGSEVNNDETLYKGELLIEGPSSGQTYPKLIIGTDDNQKVGSAPKIDFNTFVTNDVCKDFITSKLTWDEQTKSIIEKKNVKMSHDEAIKDLQEIIMNLQAYIQKIVPSPDGKVVGSTLMIGLENKPTWSAVVLGPNDNDPETPNKPARLFISNEDGLKYNIPSEDKDSWEVVPVAFS